MKIRPTTGESREHSIPIRLSEDEKSILDHAAKSKNMNVSHFIANCALRHACEIVTKDLYKIDVREIEQLLHRVLPVITKED